MGNNHSAAESARRTALSALGVKYMTHAQAIVDSYPSSELSDEQKQLCFKLLEQNPFIAGLMLSRQHLRRPLFPPCAFKHMIENYRFQETDTPHHYRGFAERSPPDTPPVGDPEADAASSSDSSSASTSLRFESSHLDVDSDEEHNALLLAKKEQ